MTDTPHRRTYLAGLLAAAIAALVAACKSAIDKTSPSSAPPASATPAAPATGVVGPVAGPSGSARTSAATTARAYREDGASHLYGLNASRIYKGRLPAYLYAIGVLNIHIDGVGRVTRMDWMRAPQHAPEVMAEIARTVEAASPFPAPARLGKVVYTETWLWHKSGRFQLDTLTEGQE